jgi:hypothetical protein
MVRGSFIRNLKTVVTAWLRLPQVAARQWRCLLNYPTLNSVLVAPNSSGLLIRDLVHSRDNNEPVYIQPLVGGRIHRIGEVIAYDVAWYPDGKHIFYSADGAVYRTDLEGGSRERLFTVPGNAYWFRWSPDTRSLRFTVIDTKSEASSLWEMASDGSKSHRLLPDFRYQQCCGSRTPGGEHFVFQVRVDNTF